MQIAYRFHVGVFVCYAICDGEHTYEKPADLLFPQATVAQLNKELCAYGIKDAKRWVSWTSTYSCLLVQAHDHNVLIDSGAGDFLPTAGRLIGHLQTIGIEPEQIDYVLLSHAHPDHIGAAQCFTRARIILNREEWRFWAGNPQLPRLPIEFREQLLTMIVPKLHSLQDRVELISPCKQILPGIEAWDAAGHTPGHMAFSIKSQGDELLYIGDAILHSIHVNQPRWSALVDVVPEQAAKTRQKLLQYAAVAPATIFGFHFPFPGIQQIPRKDGRFQQS